MIFAAAPAARFMIRIRQLIVSQQQIIQPVYCSREIMPFSVPNIQQKIISISARILAVPMPTARAEMRMQAPRLQVGPVSPIQYAPELPASGMDAACASGAHNAGLPLRHNYGNGS